MDFGFPDKLNLWTNKINREKWIREEMKKDRKIVEKGYYNINNKVKTRNWRKKNLKTQKNFRKAK